MKRHGYSTEDIISKTGLSAKYVTDIVFLLEQGEERLVEAVQRGSIPLTTALEIALQRTALGVMLQEAYENGQLNGRQIIEAKRLIEQREKHGPSSRNTEHIMPPKSSYSLVRTYQKEVGRQRKMVLKAAHSHVSQLNGLYGVVLRKSLVRNARRSFF